MESTAVLRFVLKSCCPISIFTCLSFVRSRRHLVDRDRSKSLSEKFDVQGIPSLVILSTSFDQITVDGVEQFNLNADKSFELWCQSKSLFWSKENVDNEHCWDDVVCDRCYLRPIIGKRYFHRDEDKKTNENLCQDCASSLGPLEEYLVPKKVYSIDQLLHSVPHLVKPNSEDQVSTDSLWKTDHPNIGFYFSAHWCPPCREFTPKLVEIYEKCSEELKNKFRLVFVSCDQDEQAFKEYHSTMNFLALPFQHSSIIKSYFQYQGQSLLFVDNFSSNSCRSFRNSFIDDHFIGWNYDHSSRSTSSHVKRSRSHRNMGQRRETAQDTRRSVRVGFGHMRRLSNVSVNRQSILLWNMWQLRSLLWMPKQRTRTPIETGPTAERGRRMNINDRLTEFYWLF